jgi:hypothetical protein
MHAVEAVDRRVRVRDLQGQETAEQPGAAMGGQPVVHQPGDVQLPEPVDELEREFGPGPVLVGDRLDLGAQEIPDARPDVLFRGGEQPAEVEEIVRPGPLPARGLAMPPGPRRAPPALRTLVHPAGGDAGMSARLTWQPGGDS